MLNLKLDCFDEKLAALTKRIYREPLARRQVQHLTFKGEIIAGLGPAHDASTWRTNHLYFQIVELKRFILSGHVVRNWRPYEVDLRALKSHRSTVGVFLHSIREQTT